MVAAWMSADTGVGPAMASGSHKYRGNWADLPAAPTKMSKEIAVAVLAAMGAPEKTSPYSMLP